LGRELGRPGQWVAGVAGPFVYLAKPSLAAVDHAWLLRVAQTALGQAFGVRHVLDARELARTCSPDGADALLCRSLPVDIAADLFVELDEDDFFDADLDPGLGANHGSPSRFDRSVPLYLRAPGCAPAGTLLAEPLRFDAFTRTLASLLGLRAILSRRLVVICASTSRVGGRKGGDDAVPDPREPCGCSCRRRPVFAVVVYERLLTRSSSSSTSNTRALRGRAVSTPWPCASLASFASVSLVVWDSSHRTS